MDNKKIFDVPAPSETQRLIDYETHFEDHAKNEEYWRIKSGKKMDEDLDKIQMQTKEIYLKHLNCEFFRSKLKEVYNFTQMIGPVGLAKVQPYWTSTPKIWAIEAGNIGVDSVDDFIKIYPPVDYDLYFYDIYQPQDGKFKYTVRFAVIDKPHKNLDRKNEAASVAYSNIQEFKGDIALEAENVKL